MIQTRKLSDQEVAHIFELRRQGLTMQQIADSFNPPIEYKIVRYVLGRQSYTKVRCNRSLPKRGCYIRKFKDQDIPTIYKRWLQGDTLRVIAADYGVCKKAISNIICGKTYQEIPRE